MLMKEGAYVMTDASDVIEALNREYDTELFGKCRGNAYGKRGGFFRRSKRKLCPFKQETPVHIGRNLQRLQPDTAKNYAEFNAA